MTFAAYSNKHQAIIILFCKSASDYKGNRHKKVKMMDNHLVVRLYEKSHNDLDCTGEEYYLDSPPSLIVREFTSKGIS